MLLPANSKRAASLPPPASPCTQGSTQQTLYAAPDWANVALAKTTAKSLPCSQALAPEGAEVERELRRLLPLKTKTEYEPDDVSPTTATKAVERALQERPSRPPSRQLRALAGGARRLVVPNPHPLWNQTDQNEFEALGRAALRPSGVRSHSCWTGI